MKIKIIKEVVFKDWHGTVLNVYPVGTILEATFENAYYFVTPMGGIYKDEAIRIDN